MNNTFARILGSLGLAALPAAAMAAEHQLTALGTFSNQLQSSEIERPFFEDLPEKFDGRLAVEFRTSDEVGLSGFDAMRMLKLGIFDVMAIQLGYVSGDEPFVLGLDLPGIAPDLELSRKVVDAWRDTFSTRLAEKYDATVLALWPFPGQVFFCKGELTGLSDLKGKKVRSFTPAMAQLIEYFGGTPVTMSFSEVYPGLQRGVADCGITATLSGNTAKWFEVTDTIYPLSIGWGIQANVVNNAFLDELSEADQTLLIESMKQLEDDMWELAVDSFADGVNCNTGQGTCTRGTPAQMKLTEIQEEDLEALRTATLEVVLPSWAESCDAVWPECSATWNEVVGPVVGMQVE